MAARILRAEGNTAAQTVSVWNRYQSAVFESAKNLATGKGALQMLRIINLGNSPGNISPTRYVWIWDSLSASGTPLTAPFKLGYEESFTLSEPLGLAFETGITVASSTTLGTYSASPSSNDLSITALWASAT